MRSTLRFWIIVAAAYVAAAVPLVLAGAPSAFLFAGVVGGGVAALRSGEGRALPVEVQRFGLATVGIAAGARIDAKVVETVLVEPAAILGCVFATMTVTMLFGQLLSLSRHISPTTAVFASIAGAASGVTAVVREAGGDAAVVMAIQYLRVVAVLITVPVAAQLLGGTDAAVDASTPSSSAWAGLDFTIVSLSVGLVLARIMSFSASRLVLPLLVAIALSLGDVFPRADVPPVLLALAYASIGLMVGLSLSHGTLRLLLRIMPLALLQLALGLAGCAVVGFGLAKATGMSALDGYLASTPGGLPAVTAIAISSGASVGVVVTVQLVRLFVALLLASVVGQVFARRQTNRADGPATEFG